MEFYEVSYRSVNSPGRSLSSHICILQGLLDLDHFIDHGLKKLISFKLTPRSFQVLQSNIKVHLVKSLSEEELGYAQTWIGGSL
jgi:hypothetical protein